MQVINYIVFVIQTSNATFVGHSAFITKWNVLKDVAIEWMKDTKLFVKITLKSYCWAILAYLDPFMRVSFNSPYKWQ